MFGDNVFGSGNLLTAQGERLPRNRLQGIDVVKINGFQLVNVGIDIARHGDIDDEERALDSSAQHWRKILASQERSLRRRRGNENIDLAALLRPLLEADGATAD